MIRDHFPETRRGWARLKAAWLDYRLARRQHIAAHRLAKMVEANRRSFEVEQYHRKRQSALKVTR